MRAYCVVVPSPAFDDDFGFPKRVEDLAVEQFVSQARVEALDIAVLPGAARFDVGGFCTNCGDPLLHRFGHELRPVVGPDVPRHAAKDEQVGQDVDDVDRLELAIDTDRQALVRELVDHVEHAVLAAIMRAVLDEVVGPDVVGMLGPQADAGAVGQPQPAAFGLLGRHFQPLPPPDALYSAIANRPARLTQQGSDLAIAIAAVLAGEIDDVGGQTVGIFSAPRHLALRRAVLPERRTGATLGDVQVLTNVLDAGATTRGA